MHSRRRGLLAWLGAVMLVAVGPQWAVAGEAGHVHAGDDATQVAGAPWEEQFKAQLAREDQAEGRSGHSDDVNAAMQKLMDEIAKGSNEHAAHGAKGGGFSAMGMMQQMDRSYFLGPTGAGETVTQGGRCPKGAPLREFDISAISVEITLNQWLDYHPGYMYVLTENLDKVRAEEVANREARSKEGFDPGAVSAGLQTDMIQPLNIRGNQGDCVVITLRNQMEELEEDVSLHIHGSSMIVQKTGQAATIANPDSLVKAGESQVFEWYLRPDEQEGAHAFHSHVGREQSSLGMIGTFIVEPMGSRYLDPLTGKETKSGWQVMIANANAPDFREFVIIYHEIGDESFRPLNRHDEMVPQRDPNTDAYRPSARAINFCHSCRFGSVSSWMRFFTSAMNSPSLTRWS